MVLEDVVDSLIALAGMLNLAAGCMAVGGWLVDREWTAKRIKERAGVEYHAEVDLHRPGARRV